MLITVLFNSKIYITSLNKDNSVTDLKKEILKKLGISMPLDKLLLKTKIGKDLD